MTFERVSLLFGLPVTMAEFEMRLSPTSLGNASDYLARFATPLEGRAKWEHLERAWLEDYGAWGAAPYARLIERASALPCEIRRSATLADLDAAARPGRVVVVVSHWKDAAYQNDDFLPGLDEELARRLDGSGDPLEAWMSAALREQRSFFGLRRKPGLTARQALRAALIETVAQRGSSVVDPIELPSTREARRRDRLDQLLEGLVRPGNRLELFDGLHSREEVAKALRGLDDGVLDLTVCTAAYLGDYIGRANEHRFRSVQALLPQDPTEAAERLWATLRLAAQPGWDYMSARLEVSRAFPGLVDRETRRRTETSG